MTTQRPLRELNFMDIYVCLDDDLPAHYCELVGGNNNLLDRDVPAEFHDDILKLKEALNKDFAGYERGLAFDGMRLRVAKLNTANGKTWAAMRRIPALPPKLDKLGFVPQFLPILREFGTRSGLILLCGATGQGKTTTASSLLLDCLEQCGGVAFTIEDPVEYTLEGRRGTAGYCYQSEITNDSQWGPMLKRSLRWHPRYIFVGEIRTPDAANQLLRAATSGHTVITTMHAGGMEEALEGLLQLAEQDIGARAALLLAAGLTAVVHQSLTGNGLYASFMATEANNLGSPIRSLIRDKRIGQARTFSDQQMALMMKEGKIFKDR
ncbi:MAG: ATPase, T2SS/T4P/T4SS family [Alphaproteobacteria bacterium]